MNQFEEAKWEKHNARMAELEVLAKEIAALLADSTATLDELETIFDYIKRQLRFRV